MNNTFASFSVINGVCLAPKDSVYLAVWILKCYRSSSLLSLTLPLVEIHTCQSGFVHSVVVSVVAGYIFVSSPSVDNSVVGKACFDFSYPVLTESLLLTTCFKIVQ